MKPLEIQIRFVDLDTMGHVNNAIYLSYLEQARVYYLNNLFRGEFNFMKNGFLLARNEIDYRLPLHLHNKPQVELWVQRIGNKSFDFGYRIFEGETVYAEAMSVMVSYDSEKCQTRDIHPDLMKALKELER